MPIGRKMIAFILRLPNMTNSLQLEEMNLIFVYFSFLLQESISIFPLFWNVALYDREERQLLCVPKPSKVKIGVLLEDNITQADHSSNSDVNFAVNNQRTSLYLSLSFRV